MSSVNHGMGYSLVCLEDVKADYSSQLLRILLKAYPRVPGLFFYSSLSFIPTRDWVELFFPLQIHDTCFCISINKNTIFLDNTKLTQGKLITTFLFRSSGSFRKVLDLLKYSPFHNSYRYTLYSTLNNDRKLWNGL